MFLFIINVEVVVYTDACKAKGYNVWSDTNLLQYLQCTCELCNKKRAELKTSLITFALSGLSPDAAMGIVSSEAEEVLEPLD